MTTTTHALDFKSDRPEICACGAAFVHGINLSVVKRAHLEAVAEVTTADTLAEGDVVLYPGHEAGTVLFRARTVGRIIEYPVNRVAYFTEGGYGIMDRAAEVAVLERSAATV